MDSLHLRSFILALTVVSSSLVLSACGGDDDGGSQDFGAANVAACEAYFDDVAALDCVPAGTFDDQKAMCQSTYEGVTTCDISDYFDCVAATYSCVDMAGVSVLTVDQAALNECASLASCE